MMRGMRPSILLALALGLFSAPGLAQNPNTRSMTWVEPLTASAPTVATVGCIGGAQSTRALQLDSVTAYRVQISVGSGNSLTGGFVTPWIYDITSGVWFPDLTLRVYINGGRATEVSPDQPVYVSDGCVYFATEGVQVTGSATTATVTVTAFVGGRR